MRQEAIDAIIEAFNPFTPSSGTEHVGPLLYALVRMQRFETVTEFGGGLTTAFLAAALAENEKDYVEHTASLTDRVRRRERSLRRPWSMRQSTARGPRWTIARSRRWSTTRSERCSPGPALRSHPTRASTHRLDRTAPVHVRAESELASICRSIALAASRPAPRSYVTIVPNARIQGHLDAVAPERRPIGLAWNDFGHKVRFFEETYEHVAPDGGLVAFHSPANFPDEIASIRHRLSEDLRDGRCEMFTLHEPHKTMQNGCLLIRRCASRLRAHDGAKETIASLVRLTAIE